MDENNEAPADTQISEADETPAEETTETEGAPEEPAEVVEEEETEHVDDDRPEASTIEEARDPGFKVSEGNPYAATPADGQ